MDKFKQLSLRKIILLILSLLFLGFKIYGLTLKTSIGFELIGLLIIYIPCLLIMFYKPIVASMLFGILLITQVITNGSIVILSVISMKTQIFEIDNLTVLIGYLLIVILSIEMIISIWKEVFHMKENTNRIPIIVIATLYVGMSIYLSTTSFDKTAFISGLASIFLLIIEVIHITTKEKDDSKNDIVSENEKNA